MGHALDYRSASDSGEADGLSIQPITDGENHYHLTMQRPTEHLRVRSDLLRDLSQERLLLGNIDRNVAVWGGGTLSFNGAYAGGAEGVVVLTSDMYFSPFGTAGGGVSPYTVSTKAWLTIGTPVTNQMTFTSKQKQLEGSDFPKANANEISIEIVHVVSAPSVSVEVQGAAGDASHIYVELDFGTHTCTDLKDAVDALGAAAALVDVTVIDNGLATAPKWDSTDWSNDYMQRFLKGGSAGTIHQLTAAVVATFFVTDDNKLRKGDTLAIHFEEAVIEGATTGRLQRTPENSNVALTAGDLFNTRLEPSKVSNCLPICKCLDDDYVQFLNGARIKNGQVGTLTVDSDVRIAALSGVSSEVINARTSDVYGTKGSLDLRCEDRDGEISTARTSAVYNGGVAYGSLDARLEVSDAEVAAARSSDVYGAQSTLSLRLAELDAEIDTARGLYSTLGDRIDDTGADDTFVTLGASGTDYTDIETAVAALNAADGGTIFIKEGTYALTGALTGTKPIQFIGAEENVVIDISTYTFTLAARSNVECVKVLGTTGTFVPGASSEVAVCDLFCDISHTTNQVVYTACEINLPAGELLTLASGSTILFKACHIVLDQSGTSVVHFDDAEQVTFQACEFENKAATSVDAAFMSVEAGAVGKNINFSCCDFNLPGTSVVSGAYVLLDTLPGPVTFTSCDFVVKTTTTASQNALTVKTKCSMHGVYIREHTTSQISLEGYLNIEPGAAQVGKLRAVTINCNDAELRSMPAIRLYAAANTSLRFDGFRLHSFRLPTGGGILADTDNVVNLLGADATARIKIENGNVYDITNEGSFGDLPVSLMGSESANEVVYTLKNIRFETGFSYATGGSSNDTSHLRHFNDGCTLEGCHFALVGSKYIYSCIRMVDAQHYTMNDCVFLLGGAQGAVADGIAWSYQSLTVNPFYFRCNGNFIYSENKTPWHSTSGTGHSIYQHRWSYNTIHKNEATPGDHCIAPGSVYGRVIAACIFIGSDDYPFYGADTPHSIPPEPATTIILYNISHNRY